MQGIYVLSAEIKLANLLRRLHRPPECRYGEAQNVWFIPGMRYFEKFQLGPCDFF